MFVRLRSISAFRGVMPGRHFGTASMKPYCPAGQLADKLTFIGAGKMAEAIVRPLIESGQQPAEAITLYDTNDDRLSELQEAYPGIGVSKDLSESFKDCDLILCCIKPQNTTALFTKMRLMDDDVVNPNALLVSIVAGCPLDSLSTGTGLNRVVRTMPNTPATIGQGVTVWACSDDVDDDDKESVRTLLKCMGDEIFVDDENYIDIATAISGSGPAYTLLVMEAMIDSGVHMGFPRQVAKQLVQKTILGTALYAIQSNEHPTTLRNDITSPGGTTASALYELEKGQFRSVMTDALWAAYRRSLEMGGNNSAVGPGRHRG